MLILDTEWLTLSFWTKVELHHNSVLSFYSFERQINLKIGLKIPTLKCTTQKLLNITCHMNIYIRTADRKLS